MLLALSSLLLFAQTGWANQNIVVNAFPGKVVVQVDLGLSHTTSRTDILFVIDDSGSMHTHQKNLQNNINILVDALMASKTDFRAAVTTSTSDGIDSPAKSAGYFIGNVPVISPSTPNALAELKNNLMAGVNGSGIETFFVPIKAALSEPLLSGRNKDFLREHASLSIVLVTDAEDQSPNMPVADIVGFLTGLKKNKAINVQALMVPSLVKDCTRDNPGNLPVRLEEFVTAFQGQQFNLCTPNYPGQMKTLTDNILNGAVKGGRTYPQVTRIPLPSKPDFKTIKVTWGKQVLNAGDVDYGWVYDRAKNEIALGNNVDWTSEAATTPLTIEYIPADWL